MTTKDRVEGWWWLILALIATIWFWSIVIRVGYWYLG